MPSLFTPTKIKKLALPNRFIRSATWEGLAAENGNCTPELISLLEDLAGGNAGLIITGHAYVSPAGQATLLQLGVDHDGRIKGLSQMTSAVHRKDGRIIMQLAHGGLRADMKFSNVMPSGPSIVKSLLGFPHREMTVEDIQQVVDDFSQAARRAQMAGFDGVQIHAAHGYLISQFLSPAFNRRDDDYGGSINNRSRILLEILNSIRLVVGRHFPIFVKINSEDFLEKGLTVEDCIQVGVMLDNAGVDAIEVSGGTLSSGKYVPFRKEITFERDQAYFRRTAKALKSNIQAPVVLIGGIRSYLLAERLVDEGFADYISLSRPLIREPRLIARWQSGDLRKATCVSCNGCLGAARSGKGVYCVLDRKDTELSKRESSGSGFSHHQRQSHHS
jgi:2,4-dienoyl-CoA reductase-like NADH-dependent reductase (Old Yellow Enzyme family)